MASRPAQDLDAVRHDVVIDIAPLSRHGEGVPDVAHVHATTVLASGWVVRLATDVPIWGDDDDRFAFGFRTPPAWASLVKDGDWHATLLLPRAAPGVAGTAGFEVELLDYTGAGGDIDGRADADDMVPADLSVELYDGNERPAINGRMAISWAATQDPPVDLLWQYLRL